MYEASFDGTLVIIAPTAGFAQAHARAVAGGTYSDDSWLVLAADVVDPPPKPRKLLPLAMTWVVDVVMRVRGRSQDEIEEHIFELAGTISDEWDGAQLTYAELVPYFVFEERRGPFDDVRWSDVPRSHEEEAA